MPNRSTLTNKKLNQLLLDLGFEQGETTEKNNRFWRHPQAGTTLVLPDNRTLEEPLQVDLVALRTKLDYNGHLPAQDFDTFIERGTLAHVS